LASRTRSVGSRRSAPRTGHAEHSAGNRRRPLPGLEDLLERTLAKRGVGVTQAELGIVEDGRERVVQLVADPAGQDPEAAHPLERDQLAAKGLNLFRD